MSGNPSIWISHPQRFPSPPRHSSLPVIAAPMAIPRAQNGLPPPPLPPPQHIPEISGGRDPGWQWGNDPNGSDFGRPASVKPGSSLLGESLSRRASHQERQHDPSYIDSDHLRRGSSMSTVTTSRDREMPGAISMMHDEIHGPDRRSSNHRLQGDRHLEQRTIEESSNTYDKQLLSRIGGPNAVDNTAKRSSVSYGRTEFVPPPVVDAERRLSQLRQPSLDSTFRPHWPPPGGVSPGSFAARHGSLTFDDNVSHTGSFDQRMVGPDDLAEEHRMSDLNIHDRSPGSSDDFQLGTKAGTKRRASSPPHNPAKTERSSVSSASGYNEAYHRHSLQAVPNRGSPITRFHPHHSSLSSASSHGPRHNSFGSSLGIASIPSSATSYGSTGGRLSPNASSPAFDPDIFRINAPKSDHPAASPIAFHNPVESDCVPGAPVQSSNKSPCQESLNDGVSHVHGVFVCECCPKKPKKFDAREDLRIHASEKQFTCAYCPNRFKNKNEMERHQNSLHLRRHSWSCAALAGVEAAFHSSASDTDADACGYCGQEFANPPQWEIRAEHLHHIHKFGECNQAKKFFRADHFRQHLKHSHAGTSGRWTNILETACMKDEPLPEKRGAAAGFLPKPPPFLTHTMSPSRPHAGGLGDRSPPD